MPGHTHLKLLLFYYYFFYSHQKKVFQSHSCRNRLFSPSNDSINLKKSSIFISRQKINFILHVFLEILQRYCKLVVFGTLGLSGYTHSKWYCHLVENFCVYLQAKINFIPHAFMEILHRYANLFWVFWTCLVTLTQNGSITSQKTSMFICMQKINFIIQLFLTILHFKEFCNLLGWQHFGP